MSFKKQSPREEEDLETELRRIWAKPMSKQPVYKDLPMLVGRIHFQWNTHEKEKSTSASLLEVPVLHHRVSSLRLSLDSERWDEDQDKLVDIPDEDEIQEGADPSSSSSSSSSPSSHPLFDKIKEALIIVALRLEPERADEIRKGLAATQAGRGVDLELVLPDVFGKIIGDDSKVARVFKAIHQNIIFAGCFQIKTKIPLRWMTKDVRGPEGWAIFIQINAGSVTITHRRREEALATAPPDEKFWFEWELHMTFDGNMRDLQAAGLRVSQLGFADTIGPAKKAAIQKAFCSGKMIVA